MFRTEGGAGGQLREVSTLSVRVRRALPQARPVRTPLAPALAVATRPPRATWEVVAAFFNSLAYAALRSFARFFGRGASFREREGARPPLHTQRSAELGSISLRCRVDVGSMPGRGVGLASSLGRSGVDFGGRSGL